MDLGWGLNEVELGGSKSQALRIKVVWLTSGAFQLYREKKKRDERAGSQTASEAITKCLGEYSMQTGLWELIGALPNLR